MDQKLLDIVSQFEIAGTPVSIQPVGDGLINDTLLVKTAEPDAPDYILQRVNHVVFPDVEKVMKNIIAVTRHIRRKLGNRLPLLPAIVVAEGMASDFLPRGGGNLL